MTKHVPLRCDQICEYLIGFYKAMWNFLGQVSLNKFEKPLSVEKNLEVHYGGGIIEYT